MKNPPKVNFGDTVEVVISGVVIDTKDPSSWLWIRDPYTGDYMSLNDGNSVVKSVTVVEKAKPAFFPLRNGDVISYSSATQTTEYHVVGDKAYWVAGDYYGSGVGLDYFDDADEYSRVSLLFRDGKAYNG